MKMLHVFVALTVAATSACRIELKPPAEGSITSVSGAYECAPKKKCNVNVNDYFFDETFIAVPEPGYAFLEWKKGKKHLCGGQSFDCRLSTIGLDPDDKQIDKVIKGNARYRLEPVFVDELDPPLQYISQRLFQPRCVGRGHGKGPRL